MIEFSIIDRENIQFLIRKLEDFEKDKAVKSGLRSAMNVFRIKGRDNLRNRLLYHGKHTGHLMNSFTTRVKRNKLGALAGFDRTGGNHSHLVDMGTSRRYTKGKYKRKAYRGIMPANHFWSDAGRTEKDKAVQTLYSGIQKAVQRIIDRK